MAAKGSAPFNNVDSVDGSENFEEVICYATLSCPSVDIHIVGSNISSSPFAKHFIFVV